MASAGSISALVEWATSQGAQLHPAVEVYQDAQTGLSFRVKPDAGSGTQPFEPIVSLPTSLSLSYLNALPGRDHDVKPFPASFLEKTPPHVIGRFVLAKHYLLGDASFWAPYIRALPQPSQVELWTLPPFWDDDDAELFEGTNIEVGVEQTRTNVKREFKAAQRWLDEWEPSISSRLTLPLYQWAYSIFSSRSFRPSLVLTASDRESLAPGVGIDDFSVLLPLYDVGNHDMTEEVKWELDEGRTSCNLTVARAYQPGEQVFNNYSLKTNAELLLGYGFMLPETEALHNDYVHVRKRQATSGPVTEEYYISLRPIHHPSSLLARSKQTVTLSNPSNMLKVFQHVQHDMVWDIFCTLAPPEQHPQLIPVDGSLQGDAAEQARRDAFFAGKVSDEGRRHLQQTAGIIQNKVMQELERLDETDVEAVGDEDLEQNQKLALDYRARCRRVLESTLESMDPEELFGQSA